MQLVDVFNMACHSIGARDDIASPEEESREAEVCRLWFGPVRDHVLRAAPWNEAKAFARLAVVAERGDAAWVNGDPEPGFRFAYAVPAGMLRPRYLADYSRFTLGVRNSQRVLMSNTENAILVYTKAEENLNLFDVNLQMALVHALAAFIAMPLHGRPNSAARSEEKANALIIEARVNAANDEMNTLDTIPDWIAARGYAGSITSNRYFYPYGPMISVQEMASVS